MNPPNRAFAAIAPTLPYLLTLLCLLAGLFYFDARVTYLDTGMADKIVNRQFNVANNKNLHGQVMSIGGQQYEHGIGMNAPAELEFEFEGSYDRLLAEVGVDDKGKGGRVRFSIYADRALLFDSGVLKAGSEAVAIDVAITGVTKVRLVSDIDDGESTKNYADWADLRVVKDHTATDLAAILALLAVSATGMWWVGRRASIQCPSVSVFSCTQEDRAAEKAAHLLVIASVFILMNVALWSLYRLSSRDDFVGDKVASTLAEVDAAKPEVVFVGSSIVNDGIDPALFAELTGAPTFKIAKGGWESPVWYLAIKNVVARAKVKPKFVVICFRDQDLTQANLHVKGKYKELIDSFRTPYERTLDEKAYLSSVEPATYFISQHLPLVRLREDVSEGFFAAVRTLVWESIIGKPVAEAENAKKRLFANKKMREEILSEIHLQEQATGTEAYSFHSVVDASFLPDIVRILDDNGIGLMMFRTKRSRDLLPGKQSPALLKYMADLETYMAGHGLNYYDLTSEALPKLEHYKYADHMNDIGKQVLTRLIAEYYLDTDRR